MVYGAVTQADLNLLRTHHRILVEVYILDSSRRYLFDMTKNLVSGVVDIDTESDKASRSGKLVLLDPEQRLSLDLNGSGAGANLGNRMIQIVYRVDSMDWGYSYRCPLFTGPILEAKRDGVIVNIEFAGQEILLQDGMLNDYSWPTGWRRADTIQNGAILFGGIADREDSTGDLGGAIGAPWVVEAGENLWSRFKELADAGGFNIFYNANGVLRLKPKNMTPIMELDTTWLTEEPDLVIDNSTLKNVVRVEGATIPGTDQKMTYEAWPSPQHPFSPQSLARNGFVRVIPHIIKDSSLSVWSDIMTTAWNNLTWDLQLGESVSAVAPVIPFLEEFDAIRINHPKLYSVTSLTKASIPLVGDAEMSLNFHSSTSSGLVRGGKIISNKGQHGERLLNHGPSGAFNTLGGKGNAPKGQDKYSGSVKMTEWTVNGNKGKKKKNRTKKGGK